MKSCAWHFARLHSAVNWYIGAATEPTVGKRRARAHSGTTSKHPVSPCQEHYAYPNVENMTTPATKAGTGSIEIQPIGVCTEAQGEATQNVACPPTPCIRVLFGGQGGGGQGEQQIAHRKSAARTTLETLRPLNTHANTPTARSILSEHLPTQSREVCLLVGHSTTMLASLVHTIMCKCLLRRYLLALHYSFQSEKRLATWCDV